MAPGLVSRAQAVSARAGWRLEHDMAMNAICSKVGRQLWQNEVWHVVVDQASVCFPDYVDGSVRSSALSVR
jgi:hypothetical protein